MGIAYCMKCREKKQMKQEQKVKVNGRDALRGICPKCGTKMFKFV